ncbi:Nucleoside-diphosphate-sugar epimerase [Geosmithia morbida]|uniref:Nucleoside-diphosphate-sugar epimerase n=1 Tax=Geosmithia morbida TaxID=1094350 RepID=A0A9P4YWB4_9HYPO|nr:Nucleoside-diphosphate-sugar epimerase [Geosmithia morbida]KAF4124298.1 Nucleoside-diphosphate-sugar epimerase [Geosmithia morbida]
MAGKYAKDQPAGFTNRIERVAIIGAGGHIGSHLTRALVATGKHKVTALTRRESKNEIPSGTTKVYIDYGDPESIVSALQGQQFLILTLSVFGPAADTAAKVIAAAAKAGVPYVMPNGFGIDFSDDKFAEEALLGVGVRAQIKEVEDQGVSRWVALVCSFWYEHSLALGESWFGIDIDDRTVTFLDDGKTAINSSTWEQCGRAVAAYLSLPELPADESDGGPTVSRWADRPLRISSFVVSQRDMLDSLNRVLGTTDADWKITHEPTHERYQKRLALMGEEGPNLVRAMIGAAYTRAFYPNGDGQYKDDNEAIGLKDEDIDDATRSALALLKSGYKASVFKGAGLL